MLIARSAIFLSLIQVSKLSHSCIRERQVCEFPRPASTGKIVCMSRRSTGSHLDRQAATEATEVFSSMTSSTRVTKCPRIVCIAFAVVVLSTGNLHIAYAEHAVSPSESASAVALDCFEAWLDIPADIIPAVQCMYRAWQVASWNHSRILTASLVKTVVRDIIMRVLVWMWEGRDPVPSPCASTAIELSKSPAESPLDQGPSSATRERSFVCLA
jgi:hypothetical protein